MINNRDFSLQGNYLRRGEGEKQIPIILHQCYNITEVLNHLGNNSQEINEISLKPIYMTL